MLTGTFDNLSNSGDVTSIKGLVLYHLLLLLIYSSSLTRLHNLGQYRVNEEEGVKLRKIGNDLTSMVFNSE